MSVSMIRFGSMMLYFTLYSTVHFTVRLTVRFSDSTKSQLALLAVSGGRTISQPTFATFEFLGVLYLGRVILR